MTFLPVQVSGKDPLLLVWGSGRWWVWVLYSLACVRQLT